MNVTRKSRKASRCRACGRDVRRGQPIKYRPKDARPGDARTWIHDECELEDR
jgi:hypothetical protein